MKSPILKAALLDGPLPRVAHLKSQLMRYIAIQDEFDYEYQFPEDISVFRIQEKLDGDHIGLDHVVKWSVVGFFEGGGIDYSYSREIEEFAQKGQ